MEVTLRKPYIRCLLGHRYDTMSQDIRRNDIQHDAQHGAAITTNTAQTSTAPAAPGSRHVAVTANRLDARDLFIATREIIIAHGEENYRLRLTSQNKLILTK